MKDETKVKVLMFGIILCFLTLAGLIIYAVNYKHSNKESTISDTLVTNVNNTEVSREPETSSEQDTETSFVAIDDATEPETENEIYSYESSRELSDEVNLRIKDYIEFLAKKYDTTVTLNNVRTYDEGFVDCEFIVSNYGYATISYDPDYDQWSGRLFSDDEVLDIWYEGETSLEELN
jgi:hypothetical protein